MFIVTWSIIFNCKTFYFQIYVSSFKQICCKLNLTVFYEKYFLYILSFLLCHKFVILEYLYIKTISKYFVSHIYIFFFIFFVLRFLTKYSCMSSHGWLGIGQFCNFVAKICSGFKKNNVCFVNIKWPKTNVKKKHPWI